MPRRKEALTEAQLAYPFKRVIGKGQTYRDLRTGKFAPKKTVEEFRRSSGEALREAIWNQRQQEATITARLEGRATPNGQAYNREVDERLTAFAQKRRSERTEAEWLQFRADMRYVYGDERKDWGDYD